MIIGFHHAAISTPDIKRSLDFYCGLLGFKEEYDFSMEKSGVPNVTLQTDDIAGRAVVIRSGHCYLELFQFDYPKPNPIDPERRVIDHGITHICLQVTDLPKEYERLKAQGMTFHSAPQGQEIGSLYVYGRDPDGNVVELMEVNHPEHFPTTYGVSEDINQA